MSDIKAGDLVMVVRGLPCCGGSKYMGMICTVLEGCPPPDMSCSICGCMHKNNLETVVLSLKSDRAPLVVADKNRLKKIDPPSEGDTLPTRKELDKPIKETV